MDKTALCCSVALVGRSDFRWFSDQTQRANWKGSRTVLRTSGDVDRHLVGISALERPTPVLEAAGSAWAENRFTG